MGNPNYIKGVRLERLIVNEAKGTDVIAFRSAGSRSAIDVVIIDIANSNITFVQCKTGALSKKKAKELHEKFSYLDDHVWDVNFVVEHRP